MNELYGIVPALWGDANFSRQNLRPETGSTLPGCQRYNGCWVLGKQQGDRETRDGDEVRAGMTAGCSEIYQKVRGSPIPMMS